MGLNWVRMGFMILINVKFTVRPERAESFLEDIRWYTEATRAEAGNIFFDWYVDPENSTEFILVEGFHDDGAEAHVGSTHFQRACREIPAYLVETPTIINTLIPGKVEWDRMAEFQVD